MLFSDALRSIPVGPGWQLQVNDEPTLAMQQFVLRRTVNGVDFVHELMVPYHRLRDDTKAVQADILAFVAEHAGKHNDEIYQAAQAHRMAAESVEEPVMATTTKEKEYEPGYRRIELD